MLYLRNMEERTGFKLPKQFLEQLNEFSRGYYLVVCNELGNLESYESFDNPVVQLGVLNYADAQVSAMQKHLRNCALRDEESHDADSDRN